MCNSPSVDYGAQDAAATSAEEARREEIRRQLQIDFGLDSLGAIFEGGDRHDSFESFLNATGAETPFNDPINVRRGVIQPGTPSIASGPVSTTSSPGFSGLVEGRRQNQLDFQLPQLDDRFNEGRNDLAFALSRAGLSNSSVAASRQAKLGADFQLEDAKLRSGVENDVSNLRSRIQGSRSSIEAQLRASSDPSATANTALAAGQNFFSELPPAVTIGDVFGDIASGVGQSVNAFQQNSLSNRLSAILSGSTGSSGSGRVVN